MHLVSRHAFALSVTCVSFWHIPPDMSSDNLIPNTSTDLKKLVESLAKQLNKTRSSSKFTFDPKTIQRQYSFSFPLDILELSTESDCSTVGCVKLFTPFFFGATDNSQKKNCRDLEVWVRLSFLFFSIIGRRQFEKQKSYLWPLEAQRLAFRPSRWRVSRILFHVPLFLIISQKSGSSYKQPSGRLTK